MILKRAIKIVLLDKCFDIIFKKNYINFDECEYEKYIAEEIRKKLNHYLYKDGSDDTWKNIFSLKNEFKENCPNYILLFPDENPTYYCSVMSKQKTKSYDIDYLNSYEGILLNDI